MARSFRPANSDGKASAPDWPEVICLGMLRTGTASLAKALDELGCSTYHALRALDDRWHWAYLERAAEAT
jgi:hypothetical protein